MLKELFGYYSLPLAVKCEVGKFILYTQQALLILWIYHFQIILTIYNINTAPNIPLIFNFMQ